MPYLRIVYGAVYAAVLSILIPSHAHAGTWQNECVGRLQLRLPSKAEVAGYSFSRLAAAISILPAQPRFQFGDGEEAAWSGLVYSGTVFVSNPLTSSEYNRLSQAGRVQMDIDQRRSITNKRPDGSKLEFAAIRALTNSVVAWHVSEFFTAILKLHDDHVFFWDAGGRASDEETNKAVAETILSGTSYRAPNEVPSGAGVCLPYAFIKDDGTKHRKIAMTFRLTDHPDVTVWLEDSSRVKEVARPRRNVSEEEYAIDEFWSQYEYSGTAVSARSIWEAPIKRKVTMIADGLASLVQIIREDQTADFGYFAASGIEDRLGGDGFRVRLYVIREAAHARLRGVEPIDERSFIRIAKEIAESIQWRK
jgi:hypothetical protein